MALVCKATTPNEFLISFLSAAQPGRNQSQITNGTKKGKHRTQKKTIFSHRQQNLRFLHRSTEKKARKKIVHNCATYFKTWTFKPYYSTIKLFCTQAVKSCWKISLNSHFSLTSISSFQTHFKPPTFASSLHSTFLF